MPGAPLLLSLALLGAPAAALAPCERPVRVFGDGQQVALRCPDEGMTVLDLADAWVPYPFAGAALDVGAAPPAYRDTLVALATGGAQDLELYGVTPAPQLLLAAMSDEARHRCHDGVDDEALAGVQLPLGHEDPAQARARHEADAQLATRLAASLRRRGLTDIAEFARLGPGPAKLAAQVERAQTRAAAIAAVQAHLACDGLLERPSGNLDAATVAALSTFQRRHWIVGRGELDADTRDGLLLGSRELDFRRVLRLLRQRLADAAGLIEDGSARGVWETVLGRQLDPASLRYHGASMPADGATDLIGPATEAAARALGWTSFAAARDGLRALLGGEDRRVAIPSPAVPAYHRGMLDLRATIDRPAPGERPILTLYARDGDREIALVRWPTTVGGWKSEQRPGGAIVRKYKHSDVGPRVWRDLVAAPVWYAPETTPDRELLGLQGGHWTVKDELIGPGPRSAYGLVMLVHHEPVALRTRTVMLDHGIRTHGSVSYRSILGGDSHGCHRLYNHHALRLSTFLLRHRLYVAHGPIAETYDRGVRGHGRGWSIHRDNRGFRYELTPPVPLEVGRGVLERPRGKA